MEQLQKFFINPIKNQYVDFYGIATRQQFWMYVLFYLIGYVILAVIDGILGLGLLTLIYGLGLLIPSLAITARRLHDTGRSGWWQLIQLIPLIGLIVMIVFLVQESKTTGNPYLQTATDTSADGE